MTKPRKSRKTPPPADDDNPGHKPPWESKVQGMAERAYLFINRANANLPPFKSVSTHDRLLYYTIARFYFRVRAQERFAAGFKGGISGRGKAKRRGTADHYRKMSVSRWRRIRGAPDDGREAT